MYWITKTIIAWIISNVNRQQKESSWESRTLLIKDIQRKRIPYNIFVEKKLLKSQGTLKVTPSLLAWP